MSRSDRERLADIADAAAQIVERNQAAYDVDVTLRRALERCLEIIGEAAKSLDPTTVTQFTASAVPSGMPTRGGARSLRRR